MMNFPSMRAAVRQTQKTFLRLTFGLKAGKLRRPCRLVGSRLEEILLVGEEADDIDGEEMKKREELTVGATHFDTVKERSEEKIDMSVGVALQPDLRSRLHLLVNDHSSVLSVSNLKIFLEVGLNADEINSLVFANRKPVPDMAYLESEDGVRFRLIASALAHCLEVFGSEKKAIYWLRQPLSRFQRQSPIQFIVNTLKVEELNELLTQVEEGNFA
jgi:uncharacterized protein (DUF2384 family)